MLVGSTEIYDILATLGCQPLSAVTWTDLVFLCLSGMSMELVTGMSCPSIMYGPHHLSASLSPLWLVKAGLKTRT